MDSQIQTWGSENLQEVAPKQEDLDEEEEEQWASSGFRELAHVLKEGFLFLRNTHLQKLIQESMAGLHQCFPDH